MRQFLLLFLFISLPFLAVTVKAQAINKQDVPEKVFDYLYKKHPEAEGITVEETMHFGQPLIEVKFKENKLDKNNTPYQEQLVYYFTLSGRFYTNAFYVDPNSFNTISTTVKESLQEHYPNHKTQKMLMIVNPSRSGEEYEIELLLSGETWNVIVDNYGKLISESTQEKQDF